MMQLDLDCVNRWITGNNKIQYPASIGTSCPECSMRGAFASKRRSYDEYRDTLSCSANCPACDTQVHFWITNAIAQSRKGEQDTPCLYMMPGTATALDLSDLPETVVPPKVVEYCTSTADVYASGNLTATTVLAKSAIEAIFDEHLPEGSNKLSLAELIQSSTESIGLEKPLLDLAKSVRPEGNLNSLFSSSEFTSKESADALMKLLDRLINYLYVLPNDFAELDKQFAELDRVTNLARKGLSGGPKVQKAA
ncbi:MAG: hypothetical protein ACI9UN_002084 [Granulosicoccus sp.]|jgi:hypothetical protein